MPLLSRNSMINFSPSPFCSVPFDTKYETVLNALEDAKTHAVNGGDCSVYQW